MCRVLVSCADFEGIPRTPFSEVIRNCCFPSKMSYKHDGRVGLNDVLPAIDEVVCLSVLLEGETTVSNKFTK